jgi:hypothetical protein
MRLSLLPTETGIMKKAVTSLTVDAEIVARAKDIIARSRLPFSVAKLVSSLLGEVFDLIESPTKSAKTQLIDQLRDNIHGRGSNVPPSERELTDEDLEQVAGGSGLDPSILASPRATPGAFVGKNEISLGDFVRSIVDKALEERDGTSAKAAEPPPPYITKPKPAKK